MSNKIPPGYKKTEIGIIPEDWEVKRVKDLFDIISGPFGSAIKKEILSKKGIPIYSAQNVINKDFTRVNYINIHYFRSLKQFSIKRGDILITTRGSVGKVEIVPHKIKEGIIHSNLTILRPRIKEYNLKFLKYYIGYETFQKQIFNTLSQTTINALYSSNIKNLLISLPPLPEQRAIARVFSDVDKLIEALDKLIEKKKNIKKGAMQQLLTGKKRLRGFDGEWVRKKLGEIAEIRKGDLITEKTSKRGNIPVIGGGIEPTYYHNKPNRKPNTITISASGANAGYVNFHPYPIFASDCSTIEENDNYDVKFLYYLLKLKQKDITKLQTGGAQPHVYPEQLKQVLIELPLTLEEQRAIAQILSDMDAEIEALERKKEKYEMIKKGMMELLLTGKVRIIEKNGKIEVLK